MTKNRLNRYIGTVILGSAIMAFPGCSDTWDDHFDGGDNGSVATKTLWEQITTNPDLSRFANIAQRAKYYRDESHPVNTYSYADVLKSGQVNTVWAPENGAISDELYQKLLDMAETDGYNLQLQFMANHIALWRHTFSGSEIDTVKVLNGKNLVFDKGKGTFENQPLNLKNIPAVNGTLHTLKGVADFKYNMYEYLKYGGTTTKFHDYLVACDTSYFYASASIEGRPDENGNPTYVDSVYRTSNRMLNTKRYLPNTGADQWMMCEKSFGEGIDREDSSYVMVVPTDAGWEAAYNKLKPFYKYSNFYEDKYKGDQGTTLSYKDFDPDSLTEMSIGMDIVTPLVFNVHKVGKPKDSKQAPVWQIETFAANKAATAEYYFNSVSDTLRSTDTWDKTSLFEGDPVKVSNGLAYLSNTWNFPVEFYKPDVVVEMGYGMFYHVGDGKGNTDYKVGSGSTLRYFSNEQFGAVTSKYGKVSEGNYYLLSNPTASSGATVTVKLYGNCPSAYVPNAQVMSGKYDIQVVVVPYFYNMIADAGVVDSVYLDPNYVDSIGHLNMNKIEAQLTYNNGGSKDVKFKTKWKASTDGTRVDTVTLVTDFEFPYTYKNLYNEKRGSSNYTPYSYPTLVIKSATTRSDEKKGYIYPLCIDQIILKSKETGNTIVVDPKE